MGAIKMVNCVTFSIMTSESLLMIHVYALSFTVCHRVA